MSYKSFKRKSAALLCTLMLIFACQNAFAQTTDAAEAENVETVAADVYETVASLIIGAMHGLSMPNALQMADKLYASGNIFDKEYASFLKKLRQLPTSCSESADVLLKNRKLFEKDGIFPPGVIDAQAKKLKAFKDAGLSDKLLGNEKEFAKLVQKYIHIG